MKTIRHLFYAILFILPTTIQAQGVLSFEDVMKFEDITSSSISAKGNWILYSVAPDRGDGHVVAQSVNGSSIFRLQTASRPSISANELWVAARKDVALAVQLKEKRKAPKAGMYLLSLADGSVSEFDSVSTFEFSNDGQWLAYRQLQPENIQDLKSKNSMLGTPLHLRDLSSGEHYTMPFVREFSFDSLSNFVAYSVIDTSDAENGVYVMNLESKEIQSVEKNERGVYSNLTWEAKSSDLAFTVATYNEEYERGDADLKLWDSSRKSLRTLVTASEIAEGYALRTRNRLVFTHDGERLFFGLRDRDMVSIEQGGTEAADDSAEELDIYDIDAIVGDRGLDIWHGDDPLIKTQEIVTWNRRKNHLYTSVVHLSRKISWTQLADKSMPDVWISHNKGQILGYNDQPYQREITWDGSYADWYLVDLKTATRTPLLTRFGSRPQLSPTGKFVLWYADKHWNLYRVEGGATQNLTASMDVPFFNEDHDYPSDVPGYGVAGWTKGDEHVLIYDKFDVWSFDTGSGEASSLTGGQGRAENRIFRMLDLEGSSSDLSPGTSVVLTSYHDLNKNFGFYSATIGSQGAQVLLEEDKKFTFVGKASEADAILYKREAYDEFPNLWIADDASFAQVEQHTTLHMDLKERWNWGSAELVDWLSTDGTYMQGIVIKPDNYDPDKKYPIMTYYYRFFTDRLHDFNEPKTNHRPVFAQYVSDDYVVFLPDVRFEIGRPGFAATKSIVPGIQKLVELGIADPDKLGLHGHSWSGYQTAFIVTQTDIFDAAVSGAPVSNMTSAYGGIRWASGMARSFQYEKTQSRIGKTLVEAPLMYLENSPVFYADKITTPMLIQHGDDDGAVPWYQSIEMYIAMRRYDKDVIFLQYHGEPHHLQRFENKLDYAIRMKEYFDYYLKGEGQPEWIINGEAYQGR
ncbi:MAG: S9 family peptidase [Bacteroidetes bacterium]|nr:S9 family peptidase [Bacteroidota bacterium]